MTNVYYQQPDGEEITVDLRDPRLAAFLGWLWPGAGHFYQRRFLKGFLFMICIMGTFIYGMFLGQGRVVYASFRKNDVRWQYFCQAGIGSPAILAFVQKLKTDGGNDPLFVLCERYPQGEEIDGQLREFEIVDPKDNYEGPTIKDGFMAPPVIVDDLNDNDVLGMWHASMRQRYDVGTIFTLLAGLLNILAIYDAFAGPLFSVDSKQNGSEVNRLMKWMTKRIPRTKRVKKMSWKRRVEKATMVDVNRHKNEMPSGKRSDRNEF